MKRTDADISMQIPLEKNLFHGKDIQMQRSLSLNSACEPRTKPIPESALLQELDQAKSAEHSDPSTSGQDEDTLPAKKAKKRCGVCKKRLGLTGE